MNEPSPNAIDALDPIEETMRLLTDILADPLLGRFERTCLICVAYSMSGFVPGGELPHLMQMLRSTNTKGHSE
jgi:hypothetical protein